MPDINLNYYKPINQLQKEFHASKSTHKLLIGGYGAGKSYPAIHESIFHCLQNDGHNYYMFRNTWESVEENIMNDVVRICEDNNLIKGGRRKGFSADKHDLTLVNGCIIRFRPLTLGRAKFKGINCCGWMIDDPDVNRFQDLISFLFSRLRDTPGCKMTRAQTIITANLEGRDWLYSTYMKDKGTGKQKEQGGDTKFAYWVCPTTANPTLPESFISDLAEVHTPEWMDRYVHCKLTSFIGLIYPMFDRRIHHMDYREMFKKEILHRILAVDVGISHASVVLDMFTDGENIYIPSEYYVKGASAIALGREIVEQREDAIYHHMIIDPSSAKREQTSGTSVKQLLWDEYRLNFVGANNDVDFGIQVVQDLLKPAKGPPRIYIDVKNCPNLAAEKEIYRWEEPKNLDTDHMEYRQKPVKKRDDCVDAERYGCCHLRRFMSRKHEDIMNMRQDMENRHWKDRFENLPMYRENPGMREYHERVLDKEQQDMLRKKHKKPLLSGLN